MTRKQAALVRKARAEAIQGCMETYRVCDECATAIVDAWSDWCDRVLTLEQFGKSSPREKALMWHAFACAYLKGWHRPTPHCDEWRAN